MMVEMKRKYILCFLLCFALPNLYKGDDCPSTCKTACSAADSGCSTCNPGYYGRKCQHPLQCVSGKGRDYHGTKSITENGRTCQMWNSTTPNKHPNPQYPENYCHNRATAVEDSPWCYNGEGDDPRYELCSIPSCDSQCPAPAFELFGDIQNPPDEGFYVGVVVQLVTGCGPGTTGEQECLSDKTWSSGRNCINIPWCSKPPVIDKGNISPSQVEYNYNASITISCDTGYEADGPTTLRCQPDKTWGTLPKCDRVQCSLPVLKNNSEIQNQKNEYRYKDKIEIGCKFGYSIVGQKNLVCQHDKSWSPAVPSCSPVECVLPSRTEGIVIQNSKSKYFYKDTIKVNCDAGYKLIGSTVFRCDGNTNWNGTFPTCSPLPCTVPSLPVGMSFVSNESKPYVYREKLTIMCNYTGVKTDLSCMADQTWGTIPNCTEVAKGTMAPLVTGGSPGVGAVVGGLIGAIVIVLLIVAVFFFMKRRRTRKMAKQEEAPFSQINDKDNAYMNHRGGSIGSKKQKETGSNQHASVYENVEAVYANEEQLTTKFRLENAVDYVRFKKSQTGYFKQQFSEFKAGLQRPTEEALKAANKVKNKYRNIYPYDDNRVLLTEQNSDPNSSYINASYIKGFDASLLYIAAQGPIDSTLEDFWRMVWEQNVGKIVMLTNVEENGKKKCKQYWPNTEENNDVKSVTFGDMTVVLTSEDVYSEFTIRQLTVKKKDSSDSRRVVQYHFTAWPDKSVPTYASSLAEFRRKVIATPNTSSGPPIVHCSAGIGRTGTFIALDIVMREAKRTGEADVVSCIEHLREQRLNMVQTAEQFVFLYDVLIEEHDCDISTVAASDFHGKYRELKQTDPTTKKQKLEKVFDVLQKTSPVLLEIDYETGKSNANISKNRDAKILPVDDYRPALTGEEYINAVYLPGYRNEHAFIVTQMPLTTTMVDFLNLVVEHAISCVLMLNETADKTCGIYWPTKGSGSTITVGEYSIQCLEETSKGDIKESKLKLSYGKRFHVFTQLRVMTWPDNQHVPADPSLFLQIMEQVQRGEFQHPVLVHCMNGSDKCGLFCSTVAIIDRLKLEHNVVIQHVIKQMRSRRPQIITNLAQFDFCYKVICTYLDDFETYSNFN